MTDIPQWWMKGDWFDVCSCNIPCPCEFAQPPTNNHCDGVMAYHIREGAYGDVRLDGFVGGGDDSLLGGTAGSASPVKGTENGMGTGTGLGGLPQSLSGTNT